MVIGYAFVGVVLLFLSGWLELVGCSGGFGILQRLWLVRVLCCG